MQVFSCEIFLLGVKGTLANTVFQWRGGRAITRNKMDSRCKGRDSAESECGGHQGTVSDRLKSMRDRRLPAKPTFCAFKIKTLEDGHL